LARHRKGDPEKVKMAWRLRQGSTMTLKWISRGDEVKIKKPECAM
jgi:hypothetical protein